jgi:adenosine deaminase CECR1
MISVMRHIVANAAWAIVFTCVAGGQDFSARFEEMKKQASPKQLYALLYAMPKGGDIHHHGTLAPMAEEWWNAATDPAVKAQFLVRLRFAGCADSVEPFLRYQAVNATAVEPLSDCAKAEYKPLKQLTADERQAWLDALRLDRAGEGRDEFFERVVARVRDLSRNPEVLPRAMKQYLARYGREGILYVETQMGASPWLPEAMRQMLREDKSGVTLRFQVTAVRFLPESEQRIEEAHAFVDQNRDLWVGVNIAGREDNDKGHAPRFRETFRKMRRKYSGIHLALHGGEVDSPGREVRNTLLLGAERIGHGVNLITDDDTLLLLRQGRTLIEMNLVSNKLLEYVSSYEQHPFAEYLRLGIPVCLNTDDAGSWDSNLTDEYFTAVREFNLSWDEVAQVGRNSLQYSFAPAALKADLLERFEIRLKNFEAAMSGADWRAKLDGLSPGVSGYARRSWGIQ